MDNAYILDSYALLAHFGDEDGGAEVARALRAAQSEKTKLYLSVINFGEVYYSIYRERGREKAEKAKFMIEQLPIVIVAADKDLMLDAARLKGAHAVAYADCFAAALGIRHRAKVMTGDPEFRKFGDTVAVAWIR